MLEEKIQHLLFTETR